MQKGKIAVIDDEINILKMIELSLSARGFQVEIFSNPLDAIKRFTETYFDIAFIDLKMQPINGIEVLTELKKISAETTAIMMTARS